MYPFRKTPNQTINIYFIPIGQLSTEKLQISTKIDNQDHVNQKHSGLMNRVNSAASLVTLASAAMSILPMCSLSLITTMISSIFSITITIH